MASDEWWSVEDPAVFGPVAVEVEVGENSRHHGDYLYAKWESEEYLSPGTEHEESLLLLDCDGETIKIDAGYVLRVVRSKGGLAGKVLVDHRWQGGSLIPTSGPSKSGRIGVQRDTLAGMLHCHGEDELAERAASITDDELMRIGRLGAYYAFSEDAMALGGSMGGTRALALASLDVLDGTERDLRRHHSDQELAWGLSEEPDASERARDRELRRHASQKQLPEPYS
jgi:hypothetical protein